MTEEPIDLFVHKHLEFLQGIERIWPRYSSAKQELEIYLHRERSIPPYWIRTSLHIRALHLKKPMFLPLDLHWTDLGGNVLRAIVSPCPPVFQTEVADELVPIKEFLLVAGSFAQAIPNQFCVAEEALSDSDPQDDCPA